MQLRIDGHILLDILQTSSSELRFGCLAGWVGWEDMARRGQDGRAGQVYHLQLFIAQIYIICMFLVLWHMANTVTQYDFDFISSAHSHQALPIYELQRGIPKASLYSVRRKDRWTQSYLF